MDFSFTIGLINPKKPGVYEDFLIPEVLQNMQKDSSSIALGLEDGEIACGAIGGFLDKDEEDNFFFLLSSFYISRPYRNKGGGTQLFHSLIDALSSLPTPPLYMITEFDTDTVEMECLYTFLSNMGMEDIDPDEGGDIWQSLIMMLPGKEATLGKA